MGTEPHIPTIAEVVRRAVDACDATGVDNNLGELLERFEDADEPVGDADYARRRIEEGVGAIDPQEEDGAIQTAAAVATYLVYRRVETGSAPADLLRLAARAEFDGNPPPPVANFLASAGVEV